MENCYELKGGARSVIKHILKLLQYKYGGLSKIKVLLPKGFRSKFSNRDGEKSSWIVSVSRKFSR